MNDGMTHDQATGELEALALDALDASERDAVLAHVAGCDVCRSELGVLRRTTAELTSVVAPLPMSAAQRERIRARLLARAAADQGARGDAPFTGAAGVVPIASAPSAVASRRRGMHGAGWLALAASVVAVVSAGALLRVTRDRDELRGVLQSAAAERGARAAALDSLKAVVADREQLIANLTGDQVAVMSVGATGPRSPSARMFWDQQHDAWTFIGHHLPAPKPGRTYQLWLVTPSAKISAGTFSPGRDGHAVVRATYALPKDGLAAIAVTDEPSAGSAQPTTEPFLVATAAER